MSLRSYEIIIRSYICVHHKNRQKHNQHFKIAVFHNKFTLCHINPNIYIYKNLNLPLRSSIYFVFLPLEMQKKDSNRPKYTTCFLTLSEKKQPTSLWKWQLQKPFSSVYVIATTCFNECFLFYVITGRHCFSWKFVVTLRFI